MFVPFITPFFNATFEDKALSGIDALVILAPDNTGGTANVFTPDETTAQIIFMPSSDYYQGFNKTSLLAFAEKHNLVIKVLHSPSTYLIQGRPLLVTYSNKKIQKKDIDEMLVAIDLYRGQPIDKNAYYGYHQLAEVAIKALSPGINDPETAVLSIHALTDLFRFRLFNYMPLSIPDKNNVTRIIIKELSFKELFVECFDPIWQYGKEDKYIQQAMLHMLDQLKGCDVKNTHLPLFSAFEDRIKMQQKTNDF